MVYLCRTKSRSEDRSILGCLAQSQVPKVESGPRENVGRATSIRRGPTVHTGRHRNTRVVGIQLPQILRNVMGRLVRVKKLSVRIAVSGDRYREESALGWRGPSF